MNGIKFWHLIIKSLVILLPISLIVACNLAPPSTDLFGNMAKLSDCYQVRYLGFSQEPEDVTTWNYRIERLTCSQEFNSWVLELPVCAAVVDAYPPAWKVVQTDPSLQTNTIEWSSDNGVQSRDFNVKLTGKLIRGSTHVGVIGSNLIMGEIQGPVCGLNATTPTHSFTPGTPSPTPTPTATKFIFRTATHAPATFFATDIPAKEPVNIPTDIPPTVPTLEPTPTTASLPTVIPTESPAVTEVNTLNSPDVTLPAPAQTHSP